MKLCTLFVIFISLLFVADQAASADQYYKCVTDRGTTFSQFPCGGQATQHKIAVSPNVTPATVNHVKALNSLEREQIIRNLNAEIRSVKYKLAILSRDRDRAEYEQLQRLNRLMSDDDKTKLMCLSGVKQYPMRVKCATLSWHTLVSAMDNDGKEISTES